MILPDAQDAAFAGVVLPNSGFRVVDADENWIFRINYAHEPVLIFSNPIGSPLLLFLLIERDHTSAKAQTDKLMAAANSQYRRSRAVNEISKAFEHLRLVVIKI